MRYRRFLIGISVALGCMIGLGLRVTQLTLFGNNAPIEHPERVALLVWIVWAWAYGQYIVWFVDVGAWNTFAMAIRSHCRLTLGRRAEGDAPPKWAMEQVRNSIISNLPAEARESIRYIRKYVSAPLEDSRTGPRTVNLHLTATAFLPDKRGYIDSSQTVRYEAEIPERAWKLQMLRSAIWILVTRRFTFEYFAPFAIGLLPVAMWLAPILRAWRI